MIFVTILSATGGEVMLAAALGSVFVIIFLFLLSAVVHLL